MPTRVAMGPQVPLKISRFYRRSVFLCNLLYILYILAYSGTRELEMIKTTQDMQRQSFEPLTISVTLTTLMQFAERFFWQVQRTKYIFYRFKREIIAHHFHWCTYIIVVQVRTFFSALIFLQRPLVSIVLIRYLKPELV